MALLLGSPVSVVTSAPNFGAWRTEVVTVVTAGTPVQGPTIAVPEGASVAVVAYTGNGNKRVYVANSSANAGNAAKRAELRAGVGLNLQLTNTDLLWFDAAADGAKIELTFEE